LECLKFGVTGVERLAFGVQAGFGSVSFGMTMGLAGEAGKSKIINLQS